ncbi:MAG: hypothetical protein AB7O59_03305 [Pirellulales bacterium]
MKRVALIAVALVALASVGANYLISQDAALAGGVLATLKFERVAPKPDVIGAPPKFKVSKQTIEFLTKAMKDGSIVQVNNNGSVEVVAAKK